MVKKSKPFLEDFNIPFSDDTPLKTGFEEATGDSIIKDGIDAMHGKIGKDTKGGKGLIRSGNRDLLDAKIPTSDKGRGKICKECGSRLGENILCQRCLEAGVQSPQDFSY